MPRVKRVRSGWARAAVALLGLVMPWSDHHASAADAVLSGIVTRVIDGDTIDVRLTSGPIRVRLNGIDTPEHGQPWAKEATAALSQLVMGRRVQLEPFEQDRYARLIANVFVRDLDLSAELVKRGHAWAYRKYLTSQNAQICALEANARLAKRGLWSLPADQRYAPWDWRKRPKRFHDYSAETIAACMASVGAVTHAVAVTLER